MSNSPSSQISSLPTNPFSPSPQPSHPTSYFALIVYSPSILEAYRALHEAGIIHADLETRHICTGLAGNSVRLIDFEGARYVGPDAAAREGSSVRAYLEREGNAIPNGREGAVARQAC